MPEPYTKKCFLNKDRMCFSDCVAYKEDSNPPCLLLLLLAGMSGHLNAPKVVHPQSAEPPEVRS